MKMVSTRGMAPPVSVAAAIAAGLAPDGGLYMPKALPRLAPGDFAGRTRLADVAATLLAPFFAGDVLETALPGICATAFAVEPPLRPFGADGDQVLELFHGPTGAFKDYGAGFLAAALAALPARGRPLTIVVATSGDTGAAVASAFAGRPGFRVLVLYPGGRVAPRQAHQLGCFGGNVRALRVAGTFDDCQALAKGLLGDADLQRERPMGSANSISLGRLLPQMAAYAQASLAHWRATGRPLSFVVPTGNLGNALACVMARRIGLPVGEVVLAGNANPVLAEFFAGGDYRPRPPLATLANAMDVGAPNNFERLRWLHADDDDLRSSLRAESVADADIAATISDCQRRLGETVCPHTATAAHVLARLRAGGEAGDVCIVATAHPAKFPEVVEPLTGVATPLPAALAAMLARPSRARDVAADSGTIASLLRAW